MIDTKERAFGACKIGAFIGAVEGLTSSEYHSCHEYWSSSDLKYMNKNSPAHFKNQYFPRKPNEQSDAQILGSLVHCHLLSHGEFKTEFATMPDFPKKVKPTDPTIAEQKEAWLLANSGKTPYTAKLYEKSLKMAESVQANKKAMELLNRGHKELSLFWKCKYSGLKFRVKLDSGGPMILCELKSTVSAHPHEFSRQAFNLDYDLSLVHYLEGIRTKFGTTPEVYFILVENEEPYVSQVYKVGIGFIETGHAKWLSSVDKLSAGIFKKEWPSYTTEVEEIGPPPWAWRPKVAEETKDKILEQGDDW